MFKTTPRKDRINWHDHHMLQALIIAQRSPDPNTQVGACIVDNKNRVIGLGYNGFPRGICTSQFSWDRDADSPMDTKYPYVVHAEKNAIYNAKRSVEGATLYVTMFPCNECAKDIIQAGIKQIYYLTNPYKNDWQTKAADRMLQTVDIIAVQHKWHTEKVNECLQTLTQLIK